MISPEPRPVNQAIREAAEKLDAVLKTRGGRKRLTQACMRTAREIVSEVNKPREVR